MLVDLWAHRHAEDPKLADEYVDPDPDETERWIEQRAFAAPMPQTPIRAAEANADDWSVTDQARFDLNEAPR